MSSPTVRIRLDFSPDCSVGPGKIALLEGIARTGSLSSAARVLGMSYRRAWLLIHSLNDGFDMPLVEMSVGGRDGGGARLSASGASLLTAYRAFERRVDRLAADAFDGQVRAVKTPADRERHAASRKRLPTEVKARTVRRTVPRGR